MAEKKLFTRSEIEKNNDKDKMLVILHDNVFNVHSFLNEHPGGEEVLLDHRGKDASEDFDDVGHSKDAMELMKKYRIGMLVESERTNKPAKKGWQMIYGAKTESSTKDTGIPVYLLIGGFLVILAILLYLY